MDRPQTQAVTLVFISLSRATCGKLALMLISCEEGCRTYGHRRDTYNCYLDISPREGMSARPKPSPQGTAMIWEWPSCSEVVGEGRRPEGRTHAQCRRFPALVNSGQQASVGLAEPGVVGTVCRGCLRYGAVTFLLAVFC